MICSEQHSLLPQLQPNSTVVLQSYHTEPLGLPPLNILQTHSIVNTLRCTSYCIYISTNYTYQHYIYTCKKLQCDLNTYIQSNKLIFIDLCANSVDTDNNVQITDILSVYQYIVQQCNTIKQTDNTATINIIVDNINTITQFNTINDTLDFYVLLQQLCCQKYNSTLIIGSVNDIESDHTLIQYIAHSSDIIVTVQPITYGTSKHIHGNVNYIQRDKIHKTVCTQQSHSYRYNDHGIALIT